MSIPLKFSVSAPGKVILHGEHSVVYGHQAVAASLNLRSRVDYKEIKDMHSEEQSILLSFPDVNLKLLLPTSVIHQVLSLSSDGIWDLNHPEKVAFEKLVEAVQNLMKTVPCLQDLSGRQQQTMVCCLFLMAAMFHVPHQTECLLGKPFSLEFSSELPIGAGVGSSASFCVCLAATFLLVRSSYPFTLDESKKDLISRWAFLGECIMHGKPSGLDNCICTFGSAIAFQRPNHISRISLNRCLRVLLVDTKVTRQTRTLVENVAKMKKRHGDVIENVMQAMNSISTEATDLLKQMEVSSAEDEQVEIFSRLEELWSINHSLLTAIGVSHPSLERIVELSKDYKLSGKLTGAGGGGFAIILVPPSTLKKTPMEPVLRSLVEALERNGFSVKDVELGGAGVQLHCDQL